jgi:hypothetical protein
LSLGFHRQDAVAERQAARDREVHQGTRTLTGDDVVVPRFAPDHATQRDRGRVGPANLGGRLEAQHQRRRNLQSARNCHDVISHVRGVQGRAGAGQEFVRETLIVTGLDDEDSHVGRQLDSRQRLVRVHRG